MRLDHLDTILLDCDGVIWQGNQLIPGSREAIIRLKELGKRVLYVTNNASKSRMEYMEKFKKLDIPCEIVSFP